MGEAAGSLLEAFYPPSSVAQRGFTPAQGEWSAMQVKRVLALL
jgi:hypothetical protein